MGAHGPQPTDYPQPTGYEMTLRASPNDNPNPYNIPTNWYLDYSEGTSTSRSDQKIIDGLNQRIAELHRENSKLRNELCCFYCKKNKVNFILNFFY